jgi:hypothetical protein
VSKNIQLTLNKITAKPILFGSETWTSAGAGVEGMKERKKARGSKNEIS